jgi:hypothetical protein
VEFSRYRIASVLVLIVRREELISMVVFDLLRRDSLVPTGCSVLPTEEHDSKTKVLSDIMLTHFILTIYVMSLSKLRYLHNE